MRQADRGGHGSLARIAALIGVVLLAFALVATPVFGWATGVGAQDATPAPDGTPVADGAAPVGRPAHIHAGTCAELDPTPLVPLTDVAIPTGTAAGTEAVTQVEVSVTTVPMDLATILADDHAINVHLSPEEADVYVACGEIGGIALDDLGSLAIGLREQNESGLSGIAFLTPNAADPSQTDVSIFLAAGLSSIPGLEELETPELDIDAATPSGDSETDAPDDTDTDAGSEVEGDGTPEA